MRVNGGGNASASVTPLPLPADAGVTKIARELAPLKAVLSTTTGCEPGAAFIQERFAQ